MIKEKITFDRNKSNSIKRAKKQSIALENKGYKLENTLYGLNLVQYVYTLAQ